MRIFISGGCKNGKSFYAQTLCGSMRPTGSPLYYLATMVPADDEDRQRIEKHQHEREGWGFETVEVERDILKAASTCDVTGTFLLDSVTALLANEMFDRYGNVPSVAPQKVAEELTQLTTKIDNIVFVSDYIYSDAARYDPLTEEYRRGLAFVDRTLANVCDSVLELSGGNVITHK